MPLVGDRAPAPAVRRDHGGLGGAEGDGVPAEQGLPGLPYEVTLALAGTRQGERRADPDALLPRVLGLRAGCRGWRRAGRKVHSSAGGPGAPSDRALGPQGRGERGGATGPGAGGSGARGHRRPGAGTLEPLHWGRGGAVGPSAGARVLGLELKVLARLGWGSLASTTCRVTPSPSICCGGGRVRAPRSPQCGLQPAVPAFTAVSPARSARRCLGPVSRVKIQRKAPCEGVPRA